MIETNEFCAKVQERLPGHSIALSDMWFDYQTFELHRHVIVDGVKTKINITPEFIRDLCVTLTASSIIDVENELLNIVVEEVERYLQKLT